MWKGVVSDKLDLKKKVSQDCEVLEIFDLFRSFIMSSCVNHESAALRSHVIDKRPQEHPQVAASK